MDRWRTMKSFIEEIIEEPEKYPDKLVVFTLSDEELSSIFTRERLRVLRTVQEKGPSSVRELAGMLERDIGAVDRDLKMLEKYGLIKLLREGQRVKPIIDKEGIFLPLVSPKPIVSFEKKEPVEI